MADLTNDQITAGAAVLANNGKREGFEAAAKALQERAAGHYRNGDDELQDECLQCASMLHDMKPALAAPSPQVADIAELPPLPEKWVNFMRNLANLQPELYTAHGLLTVTRAFCNTAADLLAAQPAEGAGQAGQVAMTADELAALRRFYECAADGEGYDVPKPMMRRLSEIGVVQRIFGAYYHTTEYGLAVLDSAERAAAPADQPSAQKGGEQ